MARFSVWAAAALLLSLAKDSSAFSLTDWIQNPPYQNGGTVKEQVQCYALPFGLIGFISHLLTYLTMFLLSRGRDPLLPWKMLQNKIFNLIISVAGLLITVIVTSLTIVRCRNGWALVLIATWKLVFSLALSAMAIHAACLINGPRMRQLHDSMKLNVRSLTHSRHSSQLDLMAEHDKTRGAFRAILIWSILLFLGATTGVVGVVSLVRKDFAGNHRLQIITYVFGSTAAGGTLVATVMAYVAYPSHRGSVSSCMGSLLFGATFAVPLLTILFAFYTDWALGALADDLIGVPTKDNLVFFVLYFVAKRLPMFSY